MISGEILLFIPYPGNPERPRTYPSFVVNDNMLFFEKTYLKHTSPTVVR